MSLELKNNNAHLRARAQMYKEIRQFFLVRDVLEVETPLMCSRTVSDPYIQSFAVDDFFLQTSPEYTMKRLLAAGSGSIYQICKAFRREEAGHMHNPEFTMLEWYRVGFDHLQLMNEVDELLQLLLKTEPAKQITYQQVFVDNFGFDPHVVDIDTVRLCASKHNINLTEDTSINLSITDWLQLLMTHVIEPKLIGPVPWFIYEFPVEQSALAKIIQREHLVGARFEVYIEGIELANGYYELQDAKEQRRRFEEDNVKRDKLNLPLIAPDMKLLDALERGFPECAGVAIGLDRLLMLKEKVNSIKNVLSFDVENA